MNIIDELIKFFPGIDKDVFLQKKKRWVCILESMTKEERLNPRLLKRSRKKRIAIGSGTTVQEINNLIKFYYNLKKQFKNISKMRNKEKLIKQLLNRRK